MQIQKKFINACSLYSKWNQQECEAWAAQRKVPIWYFYFIKNFHIYGICMLIGLQIATWLNYANTPDDYDWLTAVFRNYLLCAGASGLFAWMTFQFTEMSFKRRQ